MRDPIGSQEISIAQAASQQGGVEAQTNQTDERTRAEALERLVKLKKAYGVSSSIARIM
jgi:hypothetical protein